MSKDATRRVALITYAVNGEPYVGSGLLVNDRTVLTANHVADGTDHMVSCLDSQHRVGTPLRSGTPTVDLALLLLDEPIPDVDALACVKVEHGSIGQVTDCVAVGFPRWRRVGDERRSTQIDGVIPTAEGLVSGSSDDGLQLGLLTLVGNRVPATSIQRGSVVDGPERSTWGGMSGAVVLSGGAIVGVVRSINLAEDGRSLTVVPITAIDDLASPRREQFWAHLGVVDPAGLRVVGPRAAEHGTIGDYRYDVFISYQPGGEVDLWVRRRFKDKLVRTLTDQLGRPPSVLLAPDSDEAGEALAMSRVLLAVLAKPYFDLAPCRSAFDSMLRRQNDPQAPRLVHAIIAQDHRTDEFVPSEYRGRYETMDFREWAYNCDITGWEIHREYTDAMSRLAESMARAIDAAPQWSPQFPVSIVSTSTPPVQRRPTL